MNKTSVISDKSEGKTLWKSGNIVEIVNGELLTKDYAQIKLSIYNEQYRLIIKCGEYAAKH